LPTTTTGERTTDYPTRLLLRPTMSSDTSAVTTSGTGTPKTADRREHEPARGHAGQRLVVLPDYRTLPELADRGRRR
jgi:hypothetical protein